MAIQQETGSKEDIHTDPNLDRNEHPHLMAICLIMALQPLVQPQMTLPGSFRKATSERYWTLPGMTNASKVVVDEGVVTGETKPYVIYESEDTQNLQSSEDEPLPTGSDRP